MKDPGEDIRHYTYLHKSSNNYGHDLTDMARNCDVCQFLRAQLAPGQSILDCSAGRGIVLKLLSPYGFECHATEADPYLCENDLKKFNARCLRYDQLAELQPAKFDAVVSVDVLEHLFTEDAVRQALRDLAALSRQWLCISVGMAPSQWLVEGGALVTLHHVVRSPAWWNNEVGQVAKILKSETRYSSQIMYCEVPQ